MPKIEKKSIVKAALGDWTPVYSVQYRWRIMSTVAHMKYSVSTLIVFSIVLDFKHFSKTYFDFLTTFIRKHIFDYLVLEDDRSEERSKFFCF